MFKKILKLAAALVLIASLGVFMFACGDPDANGAPDRVGENGGAVTQDPPADDDGGEDQAPVEPVYVYDGLSGLDFEGRTFNIFASSHHPIHFMEFEAEELTGAVISDAIYHRNRAVEERLNVELSITFSPSTVSYAVGQAAMRNVRAGDHANHAYFGHIMRMGETALQNAFMDIYELDYINFDQPWWPTMAVENMSYRGRAILMVGEANLSYLLGAYGVFFNTQMAYDEGLPPSELYRMVLEGLWTIDRKTEIVRDFARDLDGDGEWGPNDQFGLTTTTGFAANAYLWAFGQRLVNFDHEGVPYMNLPNPLINDIVQRIYDLYFQTVGVQAVPFDNPGWRVADPLRNGNTFMINHYLNTALVLRDLEADFGILPYPKLHEGQERYFSVADGFHTAMAVPLTTTGDDFAFVGAVLESLNAETYRIVVPAYYDTALQLQGARDEYSALVMDMIRDGRLVDFGGVYDGWQGFAFAISDLMVQQSPNFASFFEQHETRARTHFQRVLDAFDRLDG